MRLTYDDYLAYMNNQAIYVSDMPTETYLSEEGCDWVRVPTENSIEIKAVINGPLCPEVYFNSSFRVVVFLRDPYYTQDDWDDDWRGGENQSICYGSKNFKDITNPTYKHLIECVFYLKRMITEGNYMSVNFSDLPVQDEVMKAARAHLCVLNACWFPHVGSPANINRCIHWLLKNQDFFSECIDLFSPTLIIGAGVLKPKSERNTNTFKLFNRKRDGYITPVELSNYGINPYCNEKDHTFLIENKLYINTYHPQNFDPYQIAKSISTLYSFHKSNKLIWNE